MLFILMKKIRRLKDLQIVKLRLESDLIAAENVLMNDIKLFKEAIKPSRIIRKIVINFFDRGNESKFSGFGKIILDLLCSKFLIDKSRLLNMLLSSVLKTISSDFVSEKEPGKHEILRNIIQKARKSIRKDQYHYDKSTIDEMDY